MRICINILADSTKSKHLIKESMEENIELLKELAKY